MKIFKASGERLSGLIFIDTLNLDTDLEPVDDAVPCLMTGKLVHGSPPASGVGDANSTSTY
jgi:hypothetical protein